MRASPGAAFGLELEAVIRELQALAERGFKPGAARQLVGLPTRPVREDPFPERYRYLAVQAYLREAISERQLAGFLRTDRVTAREIVEATLTSGGLDEQGRERSVQMPEQLSLLDSRGRQA